MRYIEQSQRRTGIFGPKNIAHFSFLRKEIIKNTLFENCQKKSHYCSCEIHVYPGVTAGGLASIRRRRRIASLRNKRCNSRFARKIADDKNFSKEQNEVPPEATYLQVSLGFEWLFQELFIFALKKLSFDAARRNFYEILTTWAVKFCSRKVCLSVSIVSSP